MTRRARSTRTPRLVALLLAGGLALAGCGGDDGASAPAATAGSTPTPVAVPAAPPAKACYRLAFAAALRPTSSARAVPCSTSHTSVTVRIGRLDPTIDGHLLAIDSRQVQNQLADRCTRRVDAHVGGSVETQRLSRVQAVWFSPTLAQSDLGALWYRCDLVIASDERTFAPLPRTTKGLLDSPGALDTYGTCGTASPAAASFTRVLCAQPHTWRARASIDLPAGTSYLGKAAGRAADATCRDTEIRRAPDTLKLRWSFEWPTKAQWKAGQRYGLCWTPS